MVKAKLLDIIERENKIYYKIQESGTGKIGTYEKSAVYAALISKKIVIEDLTVGVRLNEIKVNPTFLAKLIHSNDVTYSNENNDDTLYIYTKGKEIPLSKQLEQKERQRLSKIYRDALKEAKAKFENELYGEQDEKIVRLRILIDARSKQLEQAKYTTDISNIKKLLNKLRKELKDTIRLRDKELAKREKTNSEKLTPGKLKRYQSILDSSPSIEDFDNIIKDTETQIDEQQKILQESKLKSQKDKCARKINNLNKQLRLYRGRQDTLRGIIKKLEDNASE